MRSHSPCLCTTALPPNPSLTWINPLGVNPRLTATKLSFYAGHTHKGGREVRGRRAGARCFTRDIGTALHAPGGTCGCAWYGPDYLARGCSGRYVRAYARGYFCAWILICDPAGWPMEESSVLLATPTRMHVKFVGAVLHACMLVLCRLYAAPLHLYVCIGAILDSTQLISSGVSHEVK